MPDRALSLAFSCEHASNRIPSRYRVIADRAGDVLETHRGWDPGTAQLALELAQATNAPLFLGKWSRLLVELNRSLHHRGLWSEFSSGLSSEDKQQLLDDYYTPYREAVEDAIRREVGKGRRVVHIGVHSFTPVLNGEERRADIGLLYDPARAGEIAFCARWLDAIGTMDSSLRLRRNYPYRGAADGFTTALRKKFPADAYLGIELEVNQRFPLGPEKEWRALRRVLIASLQIAFAQSAGGR